jgi:hypothetical protein
MTMRTPQHAVIGRSINTFCAEPILSLIVEVSVGAI